MHSQQPARAPERRGAGQPGRRGRKRAQPADRGAGQLPGHVRQRRGHQQGDADTHGGHGRGGHRHQGVGLLPDTGHTGEVALEFMDLGAGRVWLCCRC